MDSTLAPQVLINQSISNQIKRKILNSQNRESDRRKEKGERLGNHQALPNLLSLASVLNASRHVCDAVFDAVGQALEAITDSLGTGGVVDGLTKTAARSAYEASCST